jgi:hypothetical protein
MKSMKWWTSLAFALVLSEPFTSPSNAATETVDGVTWSYTVAEGKAEVTGANPAEGDLAIPSSLGAHPVTSIAYHAFDGCGGLASMAIPDSVVNIGSFAFDGCFGLTNVKIGDGVASIGNYAFHDCKALTSVTMPDGVTSIGSSAFSGCSGLTSVTIGESVTNIGYSAFSGCHGLANVTIPGNVVSIGNYAFYNCSGLTGFVVDSRNPSFSSLDGVLFSRDKSTLLVFPGGKQGPYAIPDGVTIIREYAFSGCGGLTDVTIGGDVRNIGLAAFYNCADLAGVTIGASVTNIGNASFRYCSGLESVTIPDNVESIGTWAFCGCSGLTNVTIGASVTSIGSSAFFGCKNLPAFSVADGNSDFASLDGMLFQKNTATLVCCPAGKSGTCSIPACVERIKTDAYRFAFAGCTKLTAFEVADGNPAFDSYDGVLFSKDMETLVCWPGGKTGVWVIPDGVKSIGHFAFSWCGTLKTLSVPPSLDSIGHAAFFSCCGLETLFMPLSWQGKSLETAQIPARCRIVYGTRGTESVDGETWQYFIEDGSATIIAADRNGEAAIPEELGGCPVTAIAPYAFSGCEGLTDVVIPTGVTNIDHHAFSGCVGLGAVEIPSGVTEIGDYAFSGCKGLTNIVIPDTVQRIGAYAFHDCRNLTDLTFGGGVEDIGKHAFSKCRGLVNVAIPNSVAQIGDYAFYRCSGLADLVLPNGVKRIGNLAFADCDRLPSVTIPASVVELGDNPFALCDGLTEIEVDSNNGAFESQDGVLFTTDKTVLVGFPAGKEGVYSIPDDVENVGPQAFAGCIGLTTLEVGEGNANYASQDGALFSKDMTRLLVCPAGKAGSFAVPDGVVRIEDGAFADCQNLTRLMIPDSATSLGTNSLDRCDGLVALFVPEAWENPRKGNRTLNGARIQPDWKIIHGTLESEVVDGVEWHCFVEDGGSVLLPGDYGAGVEIPAELGGRPVTRIGDYAFYGCEDLKSVEIPGSVTNIGDYAFYGCEGLGDVTLPESVRSIGKWAFGGCKGMKNIKLPEGVESIGDRAFFGCSGLPEAAVPDSVASIGVNAFFGNSELTALEVGTNNANYASQDGVLFSKDMEKLLWCPDGKTGEYAIPGTVKTIAYRAFGDCVGLTAGTVPESVEKIGRNSFYGCRGLAVLYVPASWEGEPDWLDMLARAKLPPECQIIYLKDDPAETTSTTPVPVPFEWLEKKAKSILSANGWDYEAAAAATASNGLAVWKCYLAGLVPTDEGAAFKLKSFSFVNGQPVMKWDPDLNEDGTKQEREYRVWARKSVETPEPEGEKTKDGWTDVTGEEANWVTNGWRFFRVDVEMPQ